MTTPIDLDTVTLDRGTHLNPSEGLCLMEAVAYFAGESHSYAPSCVSPVLRDYGISLNDTWMVEQRQKLKPLVPLLVGTAGDGQDEARRLLALDWMVRTYTPAWLALAGFAREAAELRSLPRIVDQEPEAAAMPVIQVAGAGLDASGSLALAAPWLATGGDARAAIESATESAVWAASGAATVASAGVAVGTVAKSAIWDADESDAAVASVAKSAARAAVESAAEFAAWGAADPASASAVWFAVRPVAQTAAWAALAPTVEELQESALQLFYDMVDPSAVLP